MHIFQRRAFEHQTLMRGVLCHQTREIRDIGIFDREICGQFAIEGLDPLTRRPQLAVHPVGVLQCGFDRMATP